MKRRVICVIRGMDVFTPGTTLYFSVAVRGYKRTFEYVRLRAYVRTYYILIEYVQDTGHLQDFVKVLFTC